MAEMRERAVRMVLEHQHEFGSQWEAICSVAEKLGPTPETVRKWVRQVEIDGGVRGGLTTDERQRMKDLEKENWELRRANEILKATSSLCRRVGPAVAFHPCAVCDVRLDRARKSAAATRAASKTIPTTTGSGPSPDSPRSASVLI